MKPRRLSKVVLRVAEPERSLQFYRKFFGNETSRSAQGAAFRVAGTQLVLETSANGARAEVDRIVVACERFDRATLGKALTGLGARVHEGRGESLRFTDPMGLGIELQPA